MTVQELEALLEERKKEKEKAEKKAKKEKIINWFKENKEVAAAGGILIGKVAWDVYKKASKHAAVKSEEWYREHRTYDPKSGQYYDLRRKLSNSEKEYVSRQMAEGRLKADILRELKVI